MQWFTDGALTAYFDQPPAHVVAVNTLDHTQFVCPLSVPGVGSLCLQSILQQFSGRGPVPYGKVWLALLDVAEAANPVQLRTKEGRAYIQQQMATHNDGTDGKGCAPPIPGESMQPMMPSSAQLDNLMGTVLSAFPGLQDCISKIVQGVHNNGGSGEPDLNGVVDQTQGRPGFSDVPGVVQNVLLGPLMQNIKSTNPDAPDITPALTQILDGFRGLNAIVAKEQHAFPLQSSLVAKKIATWIRDDACFAEPWRSHMCSVRSRRSTTCRAATPPGMYTDHPVCMLLCNGGRCGNELHALLFHPIAGDSMQKGQGNPPGGRISLRKSRACGAKECIRVPISSIWMRCHPMLSMKMLQFGILDTDGVRDLSVTQVTSPLCNETNGSLNDLRMGASVNGKACITCEQQHHNCPGHFGHIRLPHPVHRVHRFHGGS